MGYVILLWHSLSLPLIIFEDTFFTGIFYLAQDIDNSTELIKDLGKRNANGAIIINQLYESPCRAFRLVRFRMLEF